VPDRPELELGFHFARAYWGYGYATEAASACLAWALANRTERILAVVDPQHRSSQRVLTKLGMHPIGRDRILDHTWLVYEAARDY
jgi:RimJ/RimL family protein N-acetyltransferase